MPKKNRKLTDEEGKALSDQEEDFNEVDLSDDEEGRRRRRRKRNQDGQAKPKVLTDEFTPSSMKQLRACVFCKLVLNREKWNKLEMCPNCHDSRGIEDTTDCFESLISLILPKRSWVAEWQKMTELIPGLYAMAINSQAHYDAGADDEFEEEDA